MRPAAQVAPDALAVLVDVVVVGQLAAAHLHDLGVVDVALDVDELQLVRLVRQLDLGLVQRAVLAAPEGLSGLDDLLHPLLELRQILGHERLGDVEVVVEAVLDRRPDAELRLREDVLHGLGEHVRGRVAQHVEPVGRVERHRGDLGVQLRRPVQVAEPVGRIAHDDDRLRARGGKAGGGHRVGRRSPGRDD
nr:hypothetical protein GCM10020092_028490 [Actinoplanes digitatis]